MDKTFDVFGYYSPLLFRPESSFRAQPFVLHQQAGELRIEGEQVRESSSRPAKFLL